MVGMVPSNMISSLRATRRGVLAHLFVTLLLSCIFRRSSGVVEKHEMAAFSKMDKIAMHFPCAEANVFHSKCACHVRCPSADCSNAVSLCKKYEKTEGCQYVLIRGTSRKIATLKRGPTAEESRRFNIDEYSGGVDESRALKRSSPKIKDLIYVGSKQIQMTLKELEADKTDPGATRHCVWNGNSTAAAAAAGVRVNPAAAAAAGVRVNPAAAAAGSGSRFRTEAFLEESIALVVISYRSPLTLANTLRSWATSGLLDMVAERMAILSDPMQSEVTMSRMHGFEVRQPKSFPNAKMSRPNVFTIGAAYYYALKSVRSEYMLFMENDFKMDVTLSRERVASELIASAGLLQRGTEIVRLLSRKGQGCGTFKDCTHSGIHLTAKKPVERVRNWFSFYCKNSKQPGAALSVSDCLGRAGAGRGEGEGEGADYGADTRLRAALVRGGASNSSATGATGGSGSGQGEGVPSYRCFTSWDSNWSLNAVMVKADTMLNKKYKTKGGMRSMGEIGLSHWGKQDGFETDMIHESRWMWWRVPICISYDGLFLHEEVETSA